jgi:hypothetical protein
MRLAMTRSQHMPLVRSASIALTGRPEIAGSFLFCKLSLRLAIGLVIAAIIIIGLTSPSGAQTASGERIQGDFFFRHQQQDDSTTLVARCLQDWDAGTHMTKQEWSGACQRLLLQRGDYLHPQTIRSRRAKS